MAAGSKMLIKVLCVLVLASCIIQKIPSVYLDTIQMHIHLDLNPSPHLGTYPDRSLSAQVHKCVMRRYSSFEMRSLRGRGK